MGERKQGINADGKEKETFLGTEDTSKATFTRMRGNSVLGGRRAAPGTEASKKGKMISPHMKWLSLEEKTKGGWVDVEKSDVITALGGLHVRRKLGIQLSPKELTQCPTEKHL